MPRTYDLKRAARATRTSEDEEVPEGKDPISKEPPEGSAEMPMTQAPGEAFALPRVARVRKAAVKQSDTYSGAGYFGTLTDKAGNPLNHADIEARIAGTMTRIPLLTPNQTREDIDNLLHGGKPSADMIKRAKDYAISRMGEGRSLFREEGEKATKLPNPAQQDFERGFAGEP